MDSYNALCLVQVWLQYWLSKPDFVCSFKTARYQFNQASQGCKPTFRPKLALRHLYAILAISKLTSDFRLLAQLRTTATYRFTNREGQ